MPVGETRMGKVGRKFDLPFFVRWVGNGKRY